MDTDYDASDYRDLVTAYADAARVLKSQAKAPATSAPSIESVPHQREHTASATPSPPTPVAVVAAPSTPSSINLRGSLADLLTSIAPKMARALPTLVEAGVEDVETLLRLREGELGELLAVTALLPFDRIVLASRLRPHLVAS